MDSFVEPLGIACVILPLALLGWMVVRLILQGSAQVLLCMECELCMGSCPLVTRRGVAFPGPKGIMVAVKAGKRESALAAGALDCNGCGVCTRICPRGLSPQDEVARWRASIGPLQSQATGPGAEAGTRPRGSGKDSLTPR
jgi:L-lactate utilization protein LutB